MKKLIILPLLFTALILFSQCPGVKNFPTMAVHLTYANWEQGAGVEIGVTGDLSKWSFHTGIDMSNRKEFDENKQKIDMLEAKAYGKFAYRLFRADYIISTYLDEMVGIDSQTGLLLATGLKVLHPMGTKAISVEPIYTINQGWSVQVALHFMLK